MRHEVQVDDQASREFDRTTSKDPMIRPQIHHRAHRTACKKHQAESSHPRPFRQFTTILAHRTTTLQIKTDYKSRLLDQSSHCILLKDRENWAYNRSTSACHARTNSLLGRCPCVPLIQRVGLQRMAFFSLVVALLIKWLRAVFRHVCGHRCCFRERRPSVADGDSACSCMMPCSDADASRFSSLLARHQAWPRSGDQSTDVFVNATTALIHPFVGSFSTVIDSVLRDGFPYGLLGSVHVSADLAVDWAAARARLALASNESSDLTGSCEWVGDRKHRRGTEAEFSVSVGNPIRVSSSSETGREVGAVDAAPDALWRASHRMLFFHGPGVTQARPMPPGAAAPDTPPVVIGEEILLARLRLPRGLTADWCALSGDYNPIHAHWLGAWAFGFRSGRRVVAHGMSVVCVALPYLIRCAAVAAAAAAKGAPAATAGAMSAGDTAGSTGAAASSGAPAAACPSAAEVRAAEELLLRPASESAKRITLRLQVAFLRPTFVPGDVLVYAGAPQVSNSSSSGPLSAGTASSSSSSSGVCAARGSADAASPAGLRSRRAVTGGFTVALPFHIAAAPARSRASAGTTNVAESAPLRASGELKPNISGTLHVIVG